MEFHGAFVRIDDLGEQNQQVDVAFRTSVAPGEGTEKYDLVRGEAFRNPPDQSIRNNSAVNGQAHSNNDNPRGSPRG